MKEFECRNEIHYPTPYHFLAKEYTKCPKCRRRDWVSKWPPQTYCDALTEAMTMLGRDKHTVFLGQAVREKGTFMSTTLQDVPSEKRIELPVAEAMQMGMCIGMALDGQIPVCCFPRWNFALLAADQLVNHLDKMGVHVIVRVGVGSGHPLDPGPQHLGNYTEAFQQMMPSTHIVELRNASAIVPVYTRALDTRRPWVIVEVADLYDEN